MSTFNGLPTELPSISIDRFDGDNLKSSCFFLSHCHTDHMKGLNKQFAELLGDNNYILYCSPISCLILLNDPNLNFPKKQIRALTTTAVIEVPANSDSSISYKITVTPLSSGHCPGSIMFLFETLQENILYTGDFRILKDDIKKFKQLHESNSVKRINKLYFDATFMNDWYWDFPTRQESVDALSKLIKEWLNKKHENIVNITTPAKYGSEYLFSELAHELKCKIFVEHHIFEKFWNVPDIGSILTNNHRETRIHACRTYHCCPPIDKSLILSIKPSAQWFQWKKGCPKPEISRLFHRKGKVCYSSHSSCSEIVEFLSYLQPKELYACTDVVGYSEAQKRTYIKRLKARWDTDYGNAEADTEKPLEVTKYMTRRIPLKIKIPAEKKGIPCCAELESPPSRLNLGMIPMASLRHLKLKAQNIIDDTECSFRNAVRNANLYFVCAVEIQRFFRGYKTRKHLAILKRKAIVIEKSWKGFVARRIYRAELKEKYEDVCSGHFSVMATYIQKVWRGYWIRTRIFCFHELRSWLEFVAKQNKLLKSSLNKYRFETNAHDMQQREFEAKEWIVYILFKLHHLMRTNQINGIYSVPKTTNLSEIEKMITCLPYTDLMKGYRSYTEDARLKNTRKSCAYTFQNCKYLAHFERELHEHEKKHGAAIVANDLYQNSKHGLGKILQREFSSYPRKLDCCHCLINAMSTKYKN